MRFEFIHVGKATFPVSVMCDVLQVSRSGYYTWVHRPRAKRDIDADGHLVSASASSG